jgi:DNA-binding transcriptional regulator YhcF (GntR family)
MSKKLSDLIGQFTTIPNSFISQSVALSTEAKWLFVVLRYHTNSKTDKAFPSYTTIQSETGFHRKTIAKALKELESSGWLTKQRRFGATTIYALQIPTSSTSDTTDAPSSSLNSTISSSISATISSSHGVHANQKKELDEEEKEPCVVVFDFYKAHLDHERTILTDERRKLLNRRFRDGYSTDDLCAAIRGCKMSAFHQGRNDRGTVYDSIELIFKDAQHVESFMSQAKGRNGNGYHPNSAASGRLIV